MGAAEQHKRHRVVTTERLGRQSGAILPDGTIIIVAPPVEPPAISQSFGKDTEGA